jgi:hypothetical protein
MATAQRTHEFDTGNDVSVSVLYPLSYTQTVSRQKAQVIVFSGQALVIDSHQIVYLGTSRNFNATLISLTAGSLRAGRDFPDILSFDVSE